MGKIIFPAELKLARDTTAAHPTTGKSVGELHTALSKLKLNIAPRDLTRKEMGDSTLEAVRQFQSRVGIQVDGQISHQTVDKINSELAHQFVAQSKTRTQRLQLLLQQAGHSIADDELKTSQFGQSTERALKHFQEKTGVAADGRITSALTDQLYDAALREKLSSKTQIAQTQKVLLRALHIAQLKDIRIDAAELKDKQIGTSARTAIRALQDKYKLPTTGELDYATYEKLQSIAQSIPEPPKILKAKNAAELKPLKKATRLNMKNAHVSDVQLTLAFLGYQIHDAEFKAQRFGPSTRAAVVSYQRSKGYAITGHVDLDTLLAFNREIKRANPKAVLGEFAYRIRGSVRDERWEGKSGVSVQIWEKLLTGEGSKLAERKTADNGFFDIPYDPPRSDQTNQIKKPFHLLIKVVDRQQQVLSQSTLFNPTQIAWANFTDGSEPYRGVSVYDARLNAIFKAMGNRNIDTVSQLQESSSTKQISQTAQTANLTAEQVMEVVLALRVAKKINLPSLTAETCFAYIAQNLPASLPNDLLDGSEDWTQIDSLVDLTAQDLVFMDDALKAAAFENAVKLNLIPITVSLQKTASLAAFASAKQTFTLKKPILMGDQSLVNLLAATSIDPNQYALVAASYTKHQNFGPEFWTEINAQANTLGGASAVKDFKSTIEIGAVTQNFEPMLIILKKMIVDPLQTHLNASQDLAKLSSDDWVTIINANGGQVPTSITGSTAQEQVHNYALTLTNQSELMFPGVALIASVARSTANPLTQIKKVQKMMDEHPDFNLRTDNIDVYSHQQNLNLDQDTLTDTRVLQRVHRIAPNALTGQVLLDNNLHSSAQIVSMGKAKFITTLMQNNRIDQPTALTAFSIAEYQYAQVLQRIADYRFDFHRADPKAILKHGYSPAELPSELSAIPNLAALFGSLDFCDCNHCQSVYGPSAYLADVLRFLDQHPAETAGKSVQDILFERRPDLGNIKLNCPNTDTPLPYIDLVNEVLENAVLAPAANANFNFQTSKTAAELRAAPEHVRNATYQKLRSSDFPLNVGFDLWQEQTRDLLQHLGLSRWSLMEALQTPQHSASSLPSAASIAGEYWQISSYETTIITATNHNTDAKQKVYWGVTSASLPTSLSVADFMRRSFLSYNEVIELLSVRWINPTNDPNNVVIERPEATCDTELQKVVHLNADRFDKLQRFLRLKNHVQWSMWQLDLLIRFGSTSSVNFDGDSLVRLQHVDQLQKRLGLSVEALLTLYSDINHEARIAIDPSASPIASFYDSLFLNPNVINPVDSAYTLPIAAGKKISEHQSTLLAAFALSETQFGLIKKKINSDDLTLANLSKIARYALLAEGLNLDIKSLLLLENLAAATITNIFATPKDTLDFIQYVDWVAQSGMSLDELDYTLGANIDSPLGLRIDSLTQSISTLRDSLKVDNAVNPSGTVISFIAATFAISANQAELLLSQIQISGQTLLTVLLNPDLIAEDSNGQFIKDITPAHFAQIYTVLKALHQLALIISRFKLDAVNLAWLLSKASSYALLNLANLPVLNPAQTGSGLFSPWLNLVKWRLVQSLYPEPEGISLRSVFDLANTTGSAIADIKSMLHQLTQWGTQAIDDLISQLGLQHASAPSDFINIDNYLRMDQVSRVASRIGVRVTTLSQWANRDNNSNDAYITTAQDVKKAAKAKYDSAAWLQKITPLEDALREKKRDALIGYLIASSVVSVPAEISVSGKTYANPAFWRDANDLLNYFLIDVEMCSCQLTSRIKQAISSTQMFVQRCLLGLEQPRIEVSRAEQQDSVSDNSWKQWKWMKNYRIWEANRKVFLYPENWIEPELRDDKSPFFEELENELLQSDMTDEHAEAAYLNYIQKVHDVSRLDIVGTYYELDDSDPRDHLPPDINVLHVIGRTKAQPALYFYRKYDLNAGEWSAWQRIDLDIQGDHVVPVVYNRRLYLFWLNFLPKPQKVKKLPAAKPSEQPSDPSEPPNLLELQLCWSAHKDDGWTTKKVSHQKIIHPWQRPLFSYNLKPRYKRRENLLWLDVYISQSQEFNSTRFWDAYRSTRDFVTARTPYDETARPWHSSSFLFDGDVVDVKMKALTGQYHVLDSNGMANEALTTTTSLTYVQDSFSDAGKAIHALSGKYEIAPRLPLPTGMRYNTTKLVNLGSNPNHANVLENGKTKTLLNGAKSSFELIASQHSIIFDTYQSDRVPLLYQDKERIFFIKPEWQIMYFGSIKFFPLLTSSSFFLPDGEEKAVKVSKSPYQTLTPMYQIASTPLLAKLGSNASFASIDKVQEFKKIPEIEQTFFGTLQTSQSYKYRFLPFYHPYSALFLRELKRSGIDGLLNRRIQTSPQGYYPTNSFNFSSYQPTDKVLVDKTVKNDQVDFERYGAYALYNWEIFFHAPLMIACKLSQNQRFEEAMRWFHYIFDPTNTETASVPQRYWITRPFFEQNSDAYRKQRIDNLLKNIEQHSDELRAWKNDPFKPHLIARYRPIAYQKTVVMKYIDNLIAWGDQLFRSDTIESINEATTLYILAYELLGRRPVKVPSVDHSDQSYNQLTSSSGLDPFGNKQVDVLMENFTGTPVNITRSSSGTEPLPVLRMFYFGIPNNDRLLEYWDTVEDRLFKIRHCMNIQGMVRQLPLFEPPIDPALLVKAAAAGIDISSVIADLNVAPAPYRFRQLAQKALEFCSDVRVLGDKLLSAIEKYDAEGISLLRNNQEIHLLQAVTALKKQQIKEANENWATLEKTKEMTLIKEGFYSGRGLMNTWEGVGMTLGGVSALAEVGIAAGYILAGGLAFIPKFVTGASGFGGSPHVTVEVVDGIKFSKASELAVQTLSAISRASEKLGSLASTMGSYHQRQDEWTLQGQLAVAERAQIDKQIEAAKIRLAIAENDLENHLQQIEQSQATLEYMQNKYTNQQLYDWLLKQVSTVYFQSYQLAYDMAKRAEKCFQHERGDAGAHYIQFGYWDSLKKGLLAGERLANDIHRMDAAYLQQNTRDLELTKHISLAQIHPFSLLALKEAGACNITIPEWLFDMDYPGHYFRRIKSVSISIPAIVGPYTSVNCTLALTNHSIRVRKEVAAGYGNPLSAADDRFFKSTTPQTAIATSHGQNDTGMFELNFNDERYLPFEGAGAVSEWRLELPQENNQFDLSTISDVILHVRYTARPCEDSTLTQAAKANLASILPPLGLKMLILNQDFGSEWYRFLHPEAGQDQTLSLQIKMEHLPFYVRGKPNLNLTQVDLIVEAVSGETYSVELTPPVGTASVNAMNPDVAYAGHQSMVKTGFAPQALVLGDWRFKIKKATAADFKTLPVNEIKNAYLVIGFKTA